MDIERLKTEGLSQEEAFALFDSLEPISTGFMIGRWKGSEVPTGHEMDGLLSVAPWYGKFFMSTERVHPLVFSDRKGRRYAVNPKKAFSLIKSPKLLGAASAFARRVTADGRSFDSHTFDALFYTMSMSKSSARLRKVRFRNVSTAAMIYDELAIIDVFRKIDDHTVLGVMDIKDLDEDKNYFFLLERVE